MDHGVLTSLVEWMLTALSAHGPFIVYVSVFFLGENGVLAGFAISAQGFISPQVVYISSLLGSMSADLFWYLMTTKYIKGFYIRKFLKHELKELEEGVPGKERGFFFRMAEKHTVIFLIFIKFLVGIRLLLTIYILVRKHIPFWKYFSINLIANVLFVSALFPVGWLVGQGISSALSIEKGVLGIITTVAIIIIFANLLPRILSFLISKYSFKNKS